jgi:hypothetical protein
MLDMLASVVNLITFGGLGQKTAGEIFSMLGCWALIVMMVRYQVKEWEKKRSSNRHYAELARKIETAMQKADISNLDELLDMLIGFNAACRRNKKGAIVHLDYAKLADLLSDKDSFHNQAVDYANKQFSSLKRGKQKQENNP